MRWPVLQLVQSQHMLYLKNRRLLEMNYNNKLDVFIAVEFSQFTNISCTDWV